MTKLKERASLGERSQGLMAVDCLRLMRSDGLPHQVSAEAEAERSRAAAAAKAERIELVHRQVSSDCH